jgi:hypothetical protein
MLMQAGLYCRFVVLFHYQMDYALMIAVYCNHRFLLRASCTVHCVNCIVVDLSNRAVCSNILYRKSRRGFTWKEANAITDCTRTYVSVETRETVAIVFTMVLDDVDETIYICFVRCGYEKDI